MYGMSKIEIEKIIKISEKIENNHPSTENEILLKKMLDFTKEMKDDLIFSNKKEIYNLKKEIEIINKENSFLKNIENELKIQNKSLNNDILKANIIINNLKDTLKEIFIVLEKIDFNNSLKKFKRLSSLFKKSDEIQNKNLKEIKILKEDNLNINKENIILESNEDIKINKNVKNDKIYHLGTNIDELH
jgi:hypothetical protein